MNARFFLLIMLIFVNFSLSKEIKQDSRRKSIQAKILFADINLAILEKRYEEAYMMAERLIREHAGDYQIDLYLGIYSQAFYYLDEDYQRDILRPQPEGIKRRIKKMELKKDKIDLDYVMLISVIWRDSPEGNFLYSKHLREFLDKFPNSLWADWAEFRLINEQGSVLRKKYSDKMEEEKYRLVYPELCKMAKEFIKKNPESYMMPFALSAVRDWSLISQWSSEGYDKVNESTKNEAVEYCRRILKVYPEAEYDCVEARCKLRLLLGKNCKDVEGYTEEGDRKARIFYYGFWDEKKDNKEYFKTKKKELDSRIKMLDK